MADFEIVIKNEHLATEKDCIKLRNKFNQLLKDINNNYEIEFKWECASSVPIIGSKILVEFESNDFDVAFVNIEDVNYIGSICYEFNKKENKDRPFRRWSYIPQE